ncbi:MAG: four helix bundle protein [Planctomycetales bacterium]
MFGFEKLEVWQKSIEFADHIYGVTRTFPGDERFGLTSQMRRASVSVASNIAEGSSRSSGRDFARFIEIACGSSMETVSHLAIARRQEMISDADHRALYEETERIVRMLSGLRNSLCK